MRFDEINNPEQLDELSWKDIQRGAKNVSKGAQKFTKNVADTGAAVGQAASDVGGAIKQVGKTAIADPVAAAYNATKGGLSKAADVTGKVYNDVKSGVQRVGRGGAGVVGDVAGGVGAVAGGATTGVGRAAATGFNTGAQAVGGDAAEPLAKVFKEPATEPTSQASAQTQGQEQPYSASPSTVGQGVPQNNSNVASIKQQIAQKQSEIQNLQAQLATASATTEPDTSSKIANGARKVGDKTASALGGLAQAWEKGAQNPGPAWGSVADTGNRKQADTNTVEVPSGNGNNIKFTRQGNQWIGADNKPVTDSATLALIKQMSAGQKAPTPVAKQDPQNAPAAQTPNAATDATVAPSATGTVAQSTTVPTAQPAANAFSRGQQSVAPSKVSYNMPVNKKPATKAAEPEATPVAESIDIADVLWRKMKNKR